MYCYVEDVNVILKFELTPVLATNAFNLIQPAPRNHR